MAGTQNVPAHFDEQWLDTQKKNPWKHNELMELGHSQSLNIMAHLIELIFFLLTSCSFNPDTEESAGEHCIFLVGSKIVKFFGPKSTTQKQTFFGVDENYSLSAQAPQQLATRCKMGPTILLMTGAVTKLPHTDSWKIPANAVSENASHTIGHDLVLRIGFVASIYPLSCQGDGGNWG